MCVHPLAQELCPKACQLGCGSRNRNTQARLLQEQLEKGELIGRHACSHAHIYHESIMCHVVVVY